MGSYKDNDRLTSNGLESFAGKLWTKIKNSFLGKNDKAASAGNADTVNGKTVEADVPADAAFTDTTYNVVSTSSDGLCPQLPDDTENTKFLRQDGTWQEPPNAEYTGVNSINVSDNVITIGVDKNNFTDSIDGDGLLHLNFGPNNYEKLADVIDDMKTKQETVSESGSTTQTITSIYQNNNGEISVQFDYIDFDGVVPNLDVSSDEIDGGTKVTITTMKGSEEVDSESFDVMNGITINEFTCDITPAVSSGSYTFWSVYPGNQNYKNIKVGDILTFEYENKSYRGVVGNFVIYNSVLSAVVRNPIQISGEDGKSGKILTVPSDAYIMTYGEDAYEIIIQKNVFPVTEGDVVVFTTNNITYIASFSRWDSFGDRDAVIVVDSKCISGKPTIDIVATDTPGSETNVAYLI